MPFLDARGLTKTYRDADVPVQVFENLNLDVDRGEMLAGWGRALLTDPKIFLADEPTGNLDLETSAKVFDLMRECHAKRGLTSVIVTHNPDLAARCDRTFTMTRRQ